MTYPSGAYFQGVNSKFQGVYLLGLPCFLKQRHDIHPWPLDGLLEVKDPDDLFGHPGSGKFALLRSDELTICFFFCIYFGYEIHYPQLCVSGNFEENHRVINNQ